MIAKSGILAILFASLCCGQLNTDNIIDKLSQHISDPSIANKLKETDVNATIAQAEDAVKQKCLKNANQAAFDTLQTAKVTAETCMKDIVDLEQLQKEIKEKSPTGELDEVFKKYCQKTPKAKQCIHDFLKALEPCLAQKERDSMKYVHNITDSFADFICFKEGDRIALFIAEKGPECLRDHQEEIQTCVNTTYGGSFSANKLPSFENLPDFDFDETNCKNMVNLQTCVVDKLEKCEQPTTANIVEALFKFVRRVTPCKDTKA